MQRAHGAGRIEARAEGLASLHQMGSAKIRFSRSDDSVREAVLINTAGGLAGGDRFSWGITLHPGARLRAVTQAEIQYESTYPANGYACSLASLGGDPNSGHPTPQAAQLLQADLASGYKSGYVFTISNCTKVTVNGTDRFTGYTLTAVPQAVGKTGDRGFCTDENNTIRYDPAGGTNCTQPIQ